MANKKKSQNSLSPAEQRLELGISLQRKNPLFSMLKGYLQVLGKKNMGGDAAYVHSGGTIYLNKDAPLTPQQWAYTIAHCKLHLAFGHFDAERMPGYSGIWRAIFISQNFCTISNLVPQPAQTQMIIFL